MNHSFDLFTTLLLFIHRFSAIAKFTYGSPQGCGGRLDVVSSTTIRSYDADRDGNYEPELNCQWVLLGSDPGKVLKMSFTTFNIERDANSTSVTCWDYVEVRDGFSPYSPLIGHFCGTEAPQPITASSNALWAKFFRCVLLKGEWFPNCRYVGIFLKKVI